MTSGRSDDPALPSEPGQTTENTMGKELGEAFGSTQDQENLPSPVDFAREVLNVKLWSKQEEVLAALLLHRRVAVKSGNGLGKGFCAAVAVQSLPPLTCPRPSLFCSPVPRLWRDLLADGWFQSVPVPPWSGVGPSHWLPSRHNCPVLLEVWPESHWPGFALRQSDVCQSYAAQ